MDQIAMTGLDIHGIESGHVGQSGGFHELILESAQVVVIENRDPLEPVIDIGIGSRNLGPGYSLRSTESAGMGELEYQERSVGRSKGSICRGPGLFDQPAEPGERALMEIELSWVRTALRHNTRGLEPDETTTTRSEPLIAPEGEVAGRTVRF